MSYRVEYLTPSGWVTGHHSFDLKDPATYCAKVLANKGTATRATDNETGATYGATAPQCPVCDAEHPPPHDGSCLL